jgi:hypothetical protein
MGHDTPNHDSSAKQAKDDSKLTTVDPLLAKLSQQSALLEKQKKTLLSVGSNSDNSTRDKDDSTTESSPITPATGTFSITPGTDIEEKTTDDGVAEMLRLKKELDAAKEKIARQEFELHKTRVCEPAPTKAKLDSATKIGQLDRAIGNLQEAYTASQRVGVNYGGMDDSRSDISDAVSAGSFSRVPGQYQNTNQGFNPGLPGVNNIWGQSQGRLWGARSGMPQLMIPTGQMRTYSGPSSPLTGSSGGGAGFMNEMGGFQGGQGVRRSNTQNNRSSGNSFAMGRNGAWNGYLGSGEVSPLSPISSGVMSPMGMFQAPMPYQPRPIGTPLSPTAPEFNVAGSTGPWNSTASLLANSIIVHL